MNSKEAANILIELSKKKLITTEEKKAIYVALTTIAGALSAFIIYGLLSIKFFEALRRAGLLIEYGGGLFILSAAVGKIGTISVDRAL